MSTCLTSRLTSRFPTAAGIVCLQVSACVPLSCCFHIDLSFTTCFGVLPSPPGPMASWAGCDHRCEQSVLLLLAKVLLSSLLVSLNERREVERPRARCATHGSLYSALPTWGSPSAATASFSPNAEVDVNGPRARSATQGSLYSALPTWGSPSAANASFLPGRSATHGSLHSALPTWGSPSAASASFGHI